MIKRNKIVLTKEQSEEMWNQPSDIIISSSIRANQQSHAKVEPVNTYIGFSKTQKHEGQLSL